MKTALVAGLVGAALMAAIWFFFLIPPPPPIPVPRIVTVHDTVKVPLPAVVIHGPPGKVTTDTINLVDTLTLHDTVQIPVNNPDTAARPNLWPILSLTVGQHRGDPTHVATFSLRSGKTATSVVWTPGPLQGAWTDSIGTPRLNFYPPAVCVPTLKQKGQYGAVGAGITELLRLLLGHP